MPFLTDAQLELELKSYLEGKLKLDEIIPHLLEALSSSQKSKRHTAQRFLQLHPEWKLWKNEFEPWLRSQSDWPWGVLVAWLAQQRLTLSIEDKKLLKATLEKQKSLNELNKNLQWEIAYPEMNEWRAESRNNLQKKISEIRELLFEELRTWKSQRLREQEIKVIERLKKKFPDDPDILKEQQNFKENQAFETLHEKLREKRNKSTRTIKFEEEITVLPDNWRQGLQSLGEKDPSTFYDLSLHCCFCEDWVWALHMINQALPGQSRDWLEIEILLKLKRYVDVLQGLTVIEMRWAHMPETFFASAYIRAQALFGLGKKEKAFEVLESLLASRPLYRQGVELLNLWRSPS